MYPRSASTLTGVSNAVNSPVSIMRFRMAAMASLSVAHTARMETSISQSAA
jgi:hypothetical protein